MYGSKGDKTAAIEIIFSHESTGQLALVVYEYEDSHYLGKKTGLGGDASVEYVCTVQAVTDSLCVEAELGQFICESRLCCSASGETEHFITDTATAPANSSSIFTTSVQFSDVNTRGPFKYPVLRTGYYCVGTVPLSSDDFAVSAFDGVVDFQNIFPGHLSASEYPKLYVSFYLRFTTMRRCAHSCHPCVVLPWLMLYLHHWSVNLGHSMLSKSTCRSLTDSALHYSNPHLPCD